MMLASATLLTLSPSVYAAPQAGAPVASSATDGTNAAYWAVVTGNAVNVRSGPSAQSAYAFGKLKQGDLVHVLKEEYGWARVQTQGNAFGDVCAFVPADRRVTLSADRTTATVGARTELRAPNVEAGSSPDKSWKQIGFADAGTTLTVLGTADGEKESVYKVKVPATAEAWINMQFLRRASDAETASATNAAATAASTPAATTVAAAPVNAAPSSANTTTDAATAGVVTPVNQPNAGAPAPTPVTPDIGSSTTATATSSAGSPAIPPLLGPKPVNAATTEGTTAPGTVVTTTVTTTRTNTPKWVSSRATFDDLEQQFKAVRSQPDAGAEFEALKAKYEDLAAQDGSAGSVKGVAGARAQQLTLLLETQSEVQKLERTKASLDTNKKGIADLILNIQRRADFTAIGILNASAVYDGQRLPELYRICDPMTSATIAYVEPNADIAMAPMIGTLVGVKGGKQFDPALRLTVISPLSIDILTQRDTPQVTKTEATRPVEEAGKFVPATTAPEAPSPESALCPEDFTPARGATP
jgi:SH3-like domain-containing protein